MNMDIIFESTIVIVNDQRIFVGSGLVIRSLLLVFVECLKVQKSSERLGFRIASPLEMEK